MTSVQVIALLEKFRAGTAPLDEVMRALQSAPVEDLGFAQLDLHRSLRKGFPEVVYGEGKTPAQVAAIAASLAKREDRLLITRVTDGHVKAVRGVLRT